MAESGVELVFAGEGNSYGRCRTEQSNLLSNKLLSLYGARKCIILPSGMSAITTTIEGLLLYYVPNNVTILYDQELYCDTPDAFDMLRMIYTPRISLVCADLSDAKILEDTIISLLQKGQYIIVFAETVSNPSGRIFAFDALNKIHKSNNMRCVIDNTWVSSISCDPFIVSPNIDVVVTSLTKYYSGGSAIGGAIMTRTSNCMKYIHQWYKTHGLHTSPHDISIINQNITTVADRVKEAGNTAMRIMTYLIDNNIKVIHPYFGARAVYISIAPAVFAVDCTCLQSQKIFDTFEKYCPDLLLKTSYGGKECRLDPYPQVHKTQDGVEFMRIRIAIGYVTPNIEELSRNILSALNDLNN